MKVVSGIYTIECVVTGEKYVGSSIDIPRRWSVHRSQLKRQIHHSKILQDRWNRYGAGGLKFEIIEIVEPDDIIAVEREYVKSGLFICNASFPMQNPMKGRKHSPESISLMRANRRGIPGAFPKGCRRSKEFGAAVSRAKKGKPRKGHRMPSHVKAALLAYSLGNTYWVGKKHTPETREKMSSAARLRPTRRGKDHPSFGRPSWNKGIPAATRGNASAAKRIKIDDVVYPSLIDAADTLGVCVSTLHKRRARGAVTIKTVSDHLELS